MNQTKSKIFLFFLLLTAISFSSFSQNWVDQMSMITYSPYYFGPNAFPIPDLYSGKIRSEYEIELRYDYHHGKGDRTQDLYGRAYFPFGKKAALELSGVIREDYKTSEALKEERHAANTRPHNGAPCYGDLILTSMYQLLESEKWMDALLTVGLKTASGNMLVDARHTDAASYWISIDLGRSLMQNKKQDKYLRIGGMIGFYCYMSNDQIHRQNDAWLAGIGIQSRLKNFYFDTDLRGFDGYWNKGDKPLLFHSKLKYRHKHHSIFFRYQTGLHDYIYQTFSGGYIFSF